MAQEVNESTPTSSTSTSNSGGSSKGTVIVVVVVIVLAVLGVGGYLVSRYFAQKIGEKTAESIIGATTGGKVDVDANGNSVTLKSDEGDIAIGTNSTWPSSMPSDVPKYSGGKITYASSETTNKTWNVGFESVPTDAYNTYKSTLTGAGWTVSSETDIGLIKTGIFEKGTWSLTFTVDPDSKGATLGVSEKI